jgi:hypothetical protein
MFGTSVGSFFFGLDYVVFSITSLFVVAPFAEYFGPKYSLGICGIALICFIAFYSIAYTTQDDVLQYTFLSIAMTLSGAIASIGWTAQGVYFARLSFLQHQIEVEMALEGNISHYYKLITSSCA